MPRLEKTLDEVRGLLADAGVASELHGDGDFTCRSVASLEQARPDQLSFARDERTLNATNTLAGALVVPAATTRLAAHQIVVDDPFAAFVVVLRHIDRERRREDAGVHPSAVVAESASLGADVSIGAGVAVRDRAVVGDCSVLHANACVGPRSRVGSDCVLFPNVVVMEDVTIGDRVVVHGGTVIGCDGYGYLQREGRHLKIPQVGTVTIGDDVEIGSQVTIDRAALDATVIGRGSKLGDLVHIAHNTIVGDNTISYRDVPAGAVLYGDPARSKTHQLRIEAVLNRLPRMERDLRDLLRRMEDRSEPE
ncbi:MAG: UDP-3-O-(3-hydroxymyristoyl)glucosamine N-acyltransferase [Acidobacteriota bacterium]|nr:UDP-3-O-(3-hydroxymyristoyl)glucosamine N-acyltransferase [Acidobacteriota bacterium]